MPRLMPDNSTDATFTRLREAINDYHAALEEVWRSNHVHHGHPPPQHALKAIYNDVMEALLLLDNARGRAMCLPPDSLVTKHEAARSLYETLAELAPMLERINAPLPLRRRTESSLNKAKLAEVVPDEDPAATAGAQEWRSL